ncbi:sensor histidine kinase [Citrobacter koseri]|uniref:sensor histidine kinase n=1 Tax=Citrobacter koseri TaxID=545 RepID=UPI0019060A75|nr:sensor histidine kinase [Citrobacter koseri]MBJ9237169.1 sensor histidine kinase [Citrobacter koseri]
MFRITARTVLELGSELISSDIIAFYELIKNGFDAQTKSGVEIRFDIPLSQNSYQRLYQLITEDCDITNVKSHIISSLDTSASEKSRNGFRSLIETASNLVELRKLLIEAQGRYNTITVSDTGSGMSLDDLNHNFLVIGTPSRKHEVEAAMLRGDKEAPYLGEKGIGRLSAMRLGEGLRVETARESDPKLNILEIDWRAFADVDAMLDQILVNPIAGPDKPSENWSGTSVIISNLSENWTKKRVEDMAEYEFARLTDPFSDAGLRPRIAIFWNSERKSIPIMPSALLSSAHARVEAKYEVIDGSPSLTCTVEALDLGFDHPKEREKTTLTVEDLQSAIIGREAHIDDSALSTVGSFSFEAYWYNRRRLTRVDAIGEQRAVRELQEKWSGIMLFRDRFRVFPYGEDEDDWLELDRRALRRSGYTLNKTQFIGRVMISRTGNPTLVDQTNREGLRITPEQRVFLEVIRYVVQDRLGTFMQDVERQYKNKKVDLSDAQTQVSKLESRAKNAIRQLKRLTPSEGNEAIEDLQQTLFEFSEFAANARQRITEVEQESRQMVEMAGVGLMVEVVAHELARASENALKELDRLHAKDMPEDLRAHFKNLQAELKSVSKRVRVLDPMSVSGRQRMEAFKLDELISDIIEGHRAQFSRHNIHIIADLPKESIRIRAVKGMIVQILENLISNSVYWLDMKAERERSFRAEIKITLESSPPTITFEDNGRGIAPDNREQVFKAFFSLKDTRRRRGLGLFIAREAAQYNGGTLTLAEATNSETGRLHRFILELPEGAQL